MNITAKDRAVLHTAWDADTTHRLFKHMHKTVARRFLQAILLLCFVVISTMPAVAQTTEEVKHLQQQMDEMREAQASLEKEVQEIRLILQRLLTQNTPPPSQQGSQQGTGVISIVGRPVRGQSEARVAVVEFSDFQCEPCARFFQDAYPQIDREYIQTGKVRYIFKNFPNENIHPEAFKAHEAAACAGDQGKFWEMHDQLFQNQAALGAEQLEKYAGTAGLDLHIFRVCMASGKHAEMIREDLKEGMRGGVRGTPVFAIGLIDPNGSSLRVMRVLAGIQPFAKFKEAIGAVLATSKKNR